MKEISLPIEPDTEGYLDKECPSESCLFLFKIHDDDWSNIVRDEEGSTKNLGVNALWRRRTLDPPSKLMVLRRGLNQLLLGGVVN